MKLNKSLQKKTSDRSCSLPITVVDNDFVQVKRQEEEKEFLYKSFGENVLKIHTNTKPNDSIEIIEEFEEFKDIIFDKKEIEFCENNLTFKRYLNSEKMDTILWIREIKLFEENDVNLSLSGKLFIKAYKLEMLYINGFDKKKRPVIYLKLSTKKLSKINDIQKLKYLAHINLKAMKLSSSKKLTYIIDLSNVSLLNVDVGWFELTLGSVHVVNYPNSISTFWNLISVGLIDEVKQKVKFSNKKELLDIVQSSELEKDYGGKS
eukprot:gene3503-6151_t